MKKFCFLLIIGFVPIYLFAQVDTLDDYFQRASSIVAIPAANGGYAFGTGFEDVGPPFGIVRITEETGNHYDSVGPILITEVLIMFIDTAIVGTPDTMEVRVYEARTDSMPKNPLIGKKILPVSNISLSGFTSVIMPNNSYTENDFFVKLIYKNIDDTIGIAANNPATNDGWGERRTRCRLDGIGIWIRAYDLYDSLDADAIIIPVVEHVAGAEELTLGGLKLRAPYPNPAAGNITIPYSLDKAQKVRITVFGLSGKICYDSGNVLKQRGSHQTEISTVSLSSGAYFYTISSEGRQLTGKLIVSH